MTPNETLKALHLAGWSYGFVKCQDREGRPFYLVDAHRGGLHLKAVGLTLGEAARTLRRLTAHLEPHQN